MQLVHMDVDPNGSNERCVFGPFSPGLNAICGPKGSGKTTLLNWLRQVASENLSYATTPTHVFSPLSGKLEIRNRGSLFTLSNQRFSSNSNFSTNRDCLPGGEYSPSYHASSLSGTQRDVFAALAAAAGATDTVASLTEIARSLELDSQHARGDFAGERRRMLDREQELMRRLGQITSQRLSRDELLKQRSRLEGELESTQRRAQALLGRNGLRSSDNRSVDARAEASELDLRHTLAEIEQLDRQIAALRAELKMQETGHHAFEIGESYRSQLQQLDDRLNRWRQTLRDLKSHREKVEHNATDARLDHQLGEQLSSSKDADPRAALRSLEAQIASTRKQLDELVFSYSTNALPAQVYSTTGGLDNAYTVHRDVHGQTRVAYAKAACASAAEPGPLLDTLRVMQRDLHEVCQQLARHEATTAAETLKQQTQQLARCEAELLQSVEKLIEERAELLRNIATEQHLSVEQLNLAFGEWCQCHDHPHLHDWLLKNEAPTATSRYQDAAARQSAIDELERLEARRKQENLRAEQCRRQMRDAELFRRDGIYPSIEPAGRLEQDILRDLHSVNVELSGFDDRERLQSELQSVRLQLSRLPVNEYRESKFQAIVDRHIIGLMGPRAQYTLARSNVNHLTNGTFRRYDTVDGVVVEQPTFRSEYDVPNAVVQTAMRLAIAEALALRGEPVSLILDEALDHLAPEIQQAAVAHLAAVASSSQQIVLLSSDEQIATRVRNLGGYVGYMNARSQPRSMDINRQLTAYANDFEADKWYQPIRPEPSTRSSTANVYYLSDRSLIEELPSIDSTAAARCRSLGIDRIGDLLDADPHWLAENVRISGISGATAQDWQAEAKLLCSVRNLRPFDARVLVGAGLRNPQQLSEMHPSALLDRVEGFLATDRGRNILRSGSSYELSNITSWIASAKSGSNRYQRTSFDDTELEEHDFRGKPQAHSRGSAMEKEYERVPRDQRSPRNGSYVSNGNSNSSELNGRSSSQYSERDRHRSRTSAQREPRSDYEPREARRVRPDREARDRSARSNARTSRPERPDAVRLARTQMDSEADARLKFYLELSSPVVDAPSIGPRMASKLEEFGIISVDQLLAANAESLADKLNLRRVDVETVRSWQEQARLVCRIPNLRGHDAQLLVACNLTSPEDLARMNPSTVLSQVLAVARTVEGQRILRGSKEPDLSEVNDWLAWAASCRNLAA
jgi:energy-coupling factor transporter ATP-binding protein EcfA2